MTPRVATSLALLLFSCSVKEPNPSVTTTISGDIDRIEFVFHEIDDPKHPARVQHFVLSSDDDTTVCYRSQFDGQPMTHWTYGAEVPGFRGSHCPALHAGVTYHANIQSMLAQSAAFRIEANGKVRMLPEPR